MLRLITCQTATLLLEQRPEGGLSRGTRASLWLHLRYCQACHRYEKQTALIAEWARAAARNQANMPTGGLSEQAKERMRQRLVEAE